MAPALSGPVKPNNSINTAFAGQALNGTWTLKAVDGVGTDTGPDVDRLKAIIEAAGSCAVFAAGGVRSAKDLATIAALRAQGAVIATALHSEAVTQNEIAALLRERRS